MLAFERRWKRALLRDPSVVLYLPLYELDGTSFKSSDNYGHLCTVTGATWGIQGRTFGGDGLIDCGDGTSLDFTGSFTLIAWAKSTIAASAIQWICGKDNNTGRNYQFQFQADGTLLVAFYASNVNKGAAAGAYTKNTWHHCAGVYNKEASTLTAYLDLVAGTPGSFSDAVDNDDVSFSIGARADLVDRGLTGQVGEVLGYNRASSLTELTRHKQATQWRYKG